ncbi:MAG: AI-2E family transporter [Rhodocyclaceae bacterium]|jgi:predicted PurR-regulated permease PerM|nr:AI-2E family transporter [Rhodocyclaceae bacterium]
MQDNQRSDRILALLSLAVLGGGCLWVLWPFMSAVLWAVILSSVTWPAFMWLDSRVGGRRTLSASLMTLLVTLVVVVPFLGVLTGLADNISELSQMFASVKQEGLPDVPDWVSGLPVIGQSLHDYWQQFSHNGARLMGELAKIAEPARNAAFATGRGLGRGLLDIALSVFLAFFFFLYGEAMAKRLRIAMVRLAGLRAEHLLRIAHGTVTGVIYGILGTALAQGLLAAFGFAIAGVPAAMLLGVATAFLSPIPVGPPLIWSGAALYLLQQGQTGWAVFVVLWGFFIVSTVDNVIKPLIISRGSSLPFAIVLLGVLGGVLAFGVIGLFIGPTLLAVGYRLTMEWTSFDEMQRAPVDGD